MRKITLCLALLILGSAAKAQSDDAFATVRYKLTHVTDTTWRDNPAVTNMVLYLGKKLNWYTDFDREERVRTTGNPFGNMRATNLVIGGSSAGAPPPPPAPTAAQLELWTQSNTVFSDASGKLTVMENAYGNLVAVTDDKTAIEWSIQPDTKEIMGIACQKANCTFKGRNYEAWFASQYPYSVGPWKLSGLPGLIIEASDAAKEVVFSFVSFENLETKKPISISTHATKVSVKDYKQYKEALERDRQAMIGSASASGGITVSGRLVSSVGPDGKPARYRMFNNPIEKAEKDAKAK